MKVPRGFESHPLRTRVSNVEKNPTKCQKPGPCGVSAIGRPPEKGPFDRFQRNSRISLHFGFWRWTLISQAQRNASSHLVRRPAGRLSRAWRFLLQKSLGATVKPAGEIREACAEHPRRVAAQLDLSVTIQRRSPGAGGRPRSVRQCLAPEMQSE